MKITENIHAIKIPFRIKAPNGNVIDRSVYVYVIIGDKITLIDTAIASPKNIIFRYISEIGRVPSEISKILISHAHPDHIGSLRSIKEETGCDVWAHPDAVKWIENINAQFAARPVPGFYDLVEGSCKVDGQLTDGQIMLLEGGPSIKVVHTPGHSRDSVSFYLEKDKVLVSGDAVISPGDMPIYEDPDALLNSLKKIEDMELDVLLSSWSEEKRGPAIRERIKESGEYIKKIDAAVKRVFSGRMNEDKMVLCAEAVEDIGLPVIAINPMVLRSFLSHLRKT